VIAVPKPGSPEPGPSRTYEQKRVAGRVKKRQKGGDQMAKAELCPVCKGEGKYKEQKCHGCNGYGWVQVCEEQVPVWPFLSEPEYPGRKRELAWRC